MASPGACQKCWASDPLNQNPQLNRLPKESACTFNAGKPLVSRLAQPACTSRNRPRKGW